MASSKVRLASRKIRPAWVVAALVLAAAAFSAKALFLDGTRYWQVVTDVPAGTELTASMLQPVQLNLSLAGANYLSGKRPQGFTAAGLSAGDLIAKSQITNLEPDRQVRVVVTSKTQLAKTIRGGVAVDIWAARKNLNEFEAPVLMVHAAGVVGVVEQKGMFSGAGQQVEVQVPAADAPALLDALALDSAIFLVPLQ